MLCNWSLKTIDPYPIIKIQCLKYFRIFKKFKKMIKNASKIRGDMRTSSKNLNMYINWKKECFKARKKWLR